jgi:E3 ubiquitin-protein ligase DOA10
LRIWNLRIKRWSETIDMNHVWCYGRHIGIAICGFRSFSIHWFLWTGSLNNVISNDEQFKSAKPPGESSMPGLVWEDCNWIR